MDIATWIKYSANIVPRFNSPKETNIGVFLILMMFLI